MYTKKHGINKNKSKNKNTKKNIKKHRYSNKKQKKTKNVIICYQSQVKNKIKGGAPTLSDLKDLIFNLEDMKELIQRYYVVVKHDENDENIKYTNAGPDKIKIYKIKKDENATNELLNSINPSFDEAITSLKTIEYTDIEQYNAIQKFLKKMKDQLPEDKYKELKDKIIDNKISDITLPENTNFDIITNNIDGYIKINNLIINTSADLGEDGTDANFKVEIIDVVKVNISVKQIGINPDTFSEKFIVGKNNDTSKEKQTLEFFKDVFYNLKWLIESNTEIEEEEKDQSNQRSVKKSFFVKQKRDMKRVFATEKLFNKVFPKDVADELGIEEQIEKALKNKEITRDQYDAMIAAIKIETKPFSTKMTESALNVAKMIGSWTIPTMGKKVEAVSKKNNKQTIKLLWFPRREYKKGDTVSTPERNEYGQFMVLVEPEKYANAWEFMNQNYFGVEDLLTNIMDGCPGTKCSNGISRHRPYKEKILDITNYQPEFDEIDKKEKEKEKGKSALTAENLEALNKENASK